MNIEKMKEIGGSEWIKGDMHRVYFNAEKFNELSGLVINFYKTGNISSAIFQGEKISNSRAYKLRADKVYFDVKAGKFSAFVDDDAALKLFAAKVREICA